LRDYILPDFVNLSRGYISERLPANKDLEKIEMGVERFALPELLFHPSDVGLQQAGIVETLMRVINEVKSHFPGMLF
jgi:actin-related protein 6